jgi:hypothetical protein
MATVNFNTKTVSDDNIKTVLDRIAVKLTADVNLLGGNRGTVPQGGSNTSYHLKHTAADFWVTGYTLESAFTTIKDKQSEIFDADKAYEVIRHGIHTKTGGAHIHIGRDPDAGKGGIEFWVEGDTPYSEGENKAKYLPG